MSKQLVWLITGTSSGLGRDLTIAALNRGDKVIATGRARSLAKLDDLRKRGAAILELDVTSPLDKLQAVAKEAVEIYGHIDVLVNNAGFMETGALEDNTPEETYGQFNTNIFGPLNVNRAFLPHMRPRRSGTIVWLGSVGGWRGVAGAGLYAGTKFATRGLSLSLHAEVFQLGLRSICFEPGYFRTNFLTADNKGEDKPMTEDYKQSVGAAIGRFNAYNGKQPGDPQKAAEVMIDVVKGEGVAAGKPFPTVVVLGSDAYELIKNSASDTLKALDVWKDATCSTDLSKEA